MSEFPINEIVAVLVSLISILIAWWQNTQKKQVIEFFTSPTTVPQVTPIQEVLALPTRSYKMQEWTRKWICAGESEEDKASLMSQVALAEEQGLTGYTIRYSKGYYEIAWGLIRSSGRDK